MIWCFRIPLTQTDGRISATGIITTCVSRRFNEIPLVIQIYRVYSAYNIIVRIAAGMAEKLQEFLNSDLKKLDNIVSTVILVAKEI